MPDKRDSRQLEVGFSRQEEADALAESMLALNQMLLNEYMKKLKSASWQVRAKSARGLGSLQSAAVPAIPSLEGLLADKDHRVRNAASQALASIRSAI
jgi:HEAT repeat protein